MSYFTPFITGDGVQLVARIGCFFSSKTQVLSLIFSRKVLRRVAKSSVDDMTQDGVDCFVMVEENITHGPILAPF